MSRAAEPTQGAMLVKFVLTTRACPAVAMIKAVLRVSCVLKAFAPEVIVEITVTVVLGSAV